ncbi:MAG: hypothetical protein M3Y60_03780, partial [Bacteroidota bacterium]|nr:hypothetical protein [Bacteroidota bacterium]
AVYPEPRAGSSLFRAVYPEPRAGSSLFRAVYPEPRAGSSRAVKGEGSRKRNDEISIEVLPSITQSL